MVVQELGVFGKDLALFGVFNVLFQLHHASFAGHHEKVVQHFQSFQVVGLVIWTAFQYGNESGEDLGDYGQRVGDEERAQRGAPDDDKFGRLNQHGQRAFFHQIPADDGSDDDDNSDYGEHSWLADSGWFLPSSVLDLFSM